MSRGKWVMTLAVALSASLVVGEVYACTGCGKANPRGGCNQLVTVKHPELKGPDRKKEFDKCLANPAGYNG